MNKEETKFIVTSISYNTSNYDCENCDYHFQHCSYLNGPFEKYKYCPGCGAKITEYVEAD